MIHLPIIKFTSQVVAQVVLDKLLTRAMDKAINVYKTKKGKVKIVDE